MFERCASSDDWAPFRLMNLLPSQWHEKHPRASSLQESPVVSVARVYSPKPEIAKFLVQRSCTGTETRVVVNLCHLIKY